MAWRPPTKYELSLLQRLLALDFPGRDELRAQLEGVLVEEVEDYGDDYGSIRFRVDVDIEAPVGTRVPVEALAMDEDGFPIDHLLHVFGGKLFELEIVKAGDNPIKCRPKASDLQLHLNTFDLT